MKTKLFFIIAVLLVGSLCFVASANYPVPFVVGESAGTSTSVNGEEFAFFTDSQKIYLSCEGCLYNRECYNIGSKIVLKDNTVEDTHKEDWKNKVYCGTGKKLFIQKLKGESCYNDFECRSDDCYNGECLQERGIITNNLKNGEDIFVNSLFIEGGKNFYFKGLEGIIHSIKIGSKEHPQYILLDGNESSPKRIINFTDNSLIIVNNFLIENGTTKVNLTFYETKKSFNNYDEIVCELLGENCPNETKEDPLIMDPLSYHNEEKSDMNKIKEITGEETGQEEVVVDKSSFEKVFGWIKKIFS